MNTDKNEHIDQQNFSKAHFDHLTVNEKIEVFVQGYRVPPKRSKAEALDILRKKIEQGSTKKITRNLRVYWSAAASIALVALLTSIYFYLSPTQIVAGKGQHIQFTLPDGSNVILNADSKITYSKSYFTENRVLNLDGEAFFSVQKGKPFVVKAKPGTVEVLGTTLNIYDRNHDFNVSCLTGKVSVAVKGQKVIIESGEKAELESGTLKKTAGILTVDMARWRTGEFHFDNMPLISIFDEIERQFNVSITAKGIENRFFTGSFSNKNLTEVLETVCLPMKLDYEIKNGNKISIKAKKN